MKKLQKHLTGIFCLVLAAALLAGCGGGAASGASSDAASSGASSAPASSEPAQAAFDYSAALTDEGFWKDVTALDLVTLGEYRGIELPAEVTTADEAEIDKQIESIRQSFSTSFEQITDRAVADGDTVNIDYVGSVDGVEFTGGNTGGQGTDVTIGVTNYIDDFLEQLIGHKPGETFDVNVTFPDGYSDGQDAEGNTVVLANKDALFVVTINYIQGEAILPTFDDAFVAENFSANYGFTTVQEVRDDIAASMVSEQETTFLTNWILENCPVSEVPESMVQYWKDATLADIASSGAMYGLDTDALLQMQGYESTEAFLDSIEESIVTNCKQYLVVQAIAEKEGLAITEADEIEAIGEENHAAVLSQFGQGYVRMTLMVGKVFDIISDSAVRQ